MVRLAQMDEKRGYRFESNWEVLKILKVEKEGGSMESLVGQS